MVRILTSLLFVLSCACATAGGDGDDGDDGRSDMIDAGIVAAKDAAVIVDAAPMPDAPMTSVDAGGPGGGFCDGNDDCGVSGECCFIALCVPGTELGDNCVPD